MNDKIKRVQELTAQLNKHRDEYYNHNAPSISDAGYDILYDELAQLEKETGIVMANSPTQTVGYAVVSNLEKTQHTIPLLSLDKTKSISDIEAFVGNKDVLAMHKLDGLTLKLVYEAGRLVEASTRGDGAEGEIVTHNAAAMSGIPLEIPYMNRLVVSGEGYILEADFEELKGILLDSSGNPYKNARNLAAGSIRCFDASACVKRRVRFTPFNVLEGLEEEPAIAASKYAKLLQLEKMGFSRCESFLCTRPEETYMDEIIDNLKKSAIASGIPIDGIVVTYDDVAYSRSCGFTGHHYKDGLAFKFEDEQFETVLRKIEWNPTRFGDIAPVAIFDPVEIDGCEVTRASLHNWSIIEALELHIGCRILVSKRNMIIPHLEDNLDRGGDILTPPALCPCCRHDVTMKTSGAKGSKTKTLLCENPECAAKNLQKFVHYVEKKAMNIEGVSEATLEKFIGKGWIQSFADIYKLSEHKKEIIAMDGFGEKSYENIIQSIENSRNTSFRNFLVGMDIPLIGRSASKLLDKVYNGDLCVFRSAVSQGTDFSALDGFGDVLNSNIHSWFSKEVNLKIWDDLFALMKFTQKDEAAAAGEPSDNPFYGCIVVATGALEHFSRDSINEKLESLGAKAGSSVSKKTHYVIAGKDAGSKLTKALELGVKVLSETEFLEMIGE